MGRIPHTALRSALGRFRLESLRLLGFSLMCHEHAGERQQQQVGQHSDWRDQCLIVCSSMQPEAGVQKGAEHKAGRYQHVGDDALQARVVVAQLSSLAQHGHGPGLQHPAGISFACLPIVSEPVSKSANQAPSLLVWMQQAAMRMLACV